jgi:hypothetical protein
MLIIARGIDIVEERLAKIWNRQANEADAQAKRDAVHELLPIRACQEREAPKICGDSAQRRSQRRDGIDAGSHRQTPRSSISCGVTDRPVLRTPDEQNARAHAWTARAQYVIARVGEAAL